MSDSESKSEFPDNRQRLAVCSSLWRGEASLETNSDKVSKTVEKSLESKLKKHKEDVGSDPKKATTLRKLKIVFNRGVGAYKTNPSSVRPTVTGPEQWAHARVNSFLYALRNLKFRGGKHDTDLLPKSHPASGENKEASALRSYPDGEEIPSELPEKYRKSKSEGETKGQACVNCEFLAETEDERFYCNKFNAPVRPQYWCAAWQGSEDALAETYNDYPESASNNAKRALKYKEEHPDNKCGTPVGWARANQLAKKEKLSRSTIARMASFKRHQQNKDVPYGEGCGGLMWDAWGGTSGIEWAISKLEQIDKEKNNRMSNKFSFRVSEVEEIKVNKEEGSMSSVSLIAIGPALGHGLYVDSKSLETIKDELGDSRLPAYITHSGAIFEDRLTREIGYLDNFRIEGDRLLGDFKAFDSFREDDSRQYNRLFELAEKVPERFGLSIVFAANSAWATADGDVSTDESPEDALFDYPSIRVEEVTSADFVDSPAANERGLFSKIDNKPNSKMTKAELTELLESLEEEKIELKTQLSKLATQVADAEALLEESETIKEDSDNEIESLKEELAAKLEEVEKLKADLAEKEEELSSKEDDIAQKDEELEGHKEEEKKLEEQNIELSSKVSALQKLIEGSEIVPANVEEEVYEPSKANRDKVIAEFARANSISEFAATLRLGKERPEIFTTNK